VTLAALVAAGLLMSAGGLGCTAGGGLVVGRPAPAFESFDLSGQPVTLAGERGHPLLVNFWASWCVPCKQEFPILSETLGRHAGLRVLGVVHQDSKANAAAFLRAQHATWPGVIDPKDQISGAYGVNGIPVTVAVDASGIVRARHIGVLQPGDGDVLAWAAGA
jgi:cytochrome c biogenesis protein CcmG/thiol:disulfide interchange protein DsbE